MMFRLRAGLGAEAVISTSMTAIVMVAASHYQARDCVKGQAHLKVIAEWCVSISRREWYVDAC